MDRSHRVSVMYIKKDWGSGKPTWRQSGDQRGRVHAIASRRVSNKEAKKLWLVGESIKAY